MPVVLLTGSEGLVGRAAHRALERAGWTVRPFDLARGDDLRDETAVFEAVRGCDTVVHAGAVAHDDNGTPAEIVATNVVGTWHVLVAAEAHSVTRVVSFSSAQVFGCADGEGEPAYLPIDDEHPLRAARPYGMSKRLAEEMTAAWTARTGVVTIVLRPVMVLSDERFRHFDATTAELGACVHVDDVADAVVAAVTVPFSGHARMLLCGPGDFDSAAARRVLGWRARRTRVSQAFPAGGR